MTCTNVIRFHKFSVRYGFALSCGLTLFIHKLFSLEIDVKMKKIKLTQSIIFLAIVFSIIDSTNAVAEDSQTAHIQNYNASSSLESLIEKDFNCTDKSESHLKSKHRKARYVAFPEGSSFSVKEEYR